MWFTTSFNVLVARGAINIPDSLIDIIKSFICPYCRNEYCECGNNEPRCAGCYRIIYGQVLNAWSSNKPTITGGFYTTPTCSEFCRNVVETQTEADEAVLAQQVEDAVVYRDVDRVDTDLPS
jgi:hypothetical protein